MYILVESGYAGQFSTERSKGREVIESLAHPPRWSVHRNFAASIGTDCRLYWYRDCRLYWYRGRIYWYRLPPLLAYIQPTRPQANPKRNIACTVLYLYCTYIWNKYSKRVASATKYSTLVVRVTKDTSLLLHRLGYTHKMSNYWTSSFKTSSYITSSYITSSYKTSSLPNVQISKRPVTKGPD